MSWLGKLFGNKNKKEDTEAKLSNLLHEQTGDPAFLHRTNWITAYGEKDYNKALDEINKALQIAPNHPDYMALRGMTHYSIGNYVEANSDISTVLKNNPSHKEAADLSQALKTDAMQCRDKARELARNNKMREAVDLLNKAAQLEPDNPLTFFFRGTTHAQLGDFRSALNDINHTLQLDPQYPKAKDIRQAVQNMAAEQ